MAKSISSYHSANNSRFHDDYQKKAKLLFLQVIPMVLLFIIAFAFVFTMLMPRDNGFAMFTTSFLTTFVMMSGEIDFRDVFLDSEDTSFRYLQRIFLIFFLILVCIAVMNLLTGLAVDDTNEIMRRSQQEKRIHKVSFSPVMQNIKRLNNLAL